MATDELFDIEGKCIAITGGAGVLCGQLARDLARRGAKIAVCDVADKPAEALCKEIAAAGGHAVAVRCNVLDKDATEAAARETVSKLGRVDVLINGAGGNKKEATTSATMPFFNMPPEALQFVFNLNLIGTVMPSQVFGWLMVEQKSGIILNISSMSAFRPLTNVAGYSAAKAAVSNFTQWLAVHMSQNYSKDIRVNAIAPGFFLTEQNRFLLTDEKTGQRTARGARIIDHTPMGRYGDPEDLIGAVVWLLSDGAKFVHGTVIPIDGGFAAYSGV